MSSENSIYVSLLLGLMTFVFGIVYFFDALDKTKKGLIILLELKQSIINNVRTKIDDYLDRESFDELIQRKEVDIFLSQERSRISWKVRD